MSKEYDANLIINLKARIEELEAQPKELEKQRDDLLRVTKEFVDHVEHLPYMAKVEFFLDGFDGCMVAKKLIKQAER